MAAVHAVPCRSDTRVSKTPAARTVLSFFPISMLQHPASCLVSSSFCFHHESPLVSARSASLGSRLFLSLSVCDVPSSFVSHTDSATCSAAWAHRCGPCVIVMQPALPIDDVRWPHPVSPHPSHGAPSTVGSSPLISSILLSMVLQCRRPSTRLLPNRLSRISRLSLLTDRRARIACCTSPPMMADWRAGIPSVFGGQQVLPLPSPILPSPLPPCSPPCSNIFGSLVPSLSPTRFSWPGLLHLREH